MIKPHIKEQVTTIRRAAENALSDKTHEIRIRNYDFLEVCDSLYQHLEHIHTEVQRLEKWINE